MELNGSQNSTSTRLVLTLDSIDYFQTNKTWEAILMA